MKVSQNLFLWVEGFHSVSSGASFFHRQTVVGTLLLAVKHGLVNNFIPWTLFVVVQTIFKIAFRSPSDDIRNYILGDENWNPHDA